MDELQLTPTEMSEVIDVLGSLIDGFDQDVFDNSTAADVMADLLPELRSRSAALGGKLEWQSMRNPAYNKVMTKVREYLAGLRIPEPTPKTKK